MHGYSKYMALTQCWLDDGKEKKGTMGWLVSGGMGGGLEIGTAELYVSCDSEEG